MIKRKAEQIVEKRENMRKGSGTISIRHYFTKDEISAPCRLCAEMVVPPGGSVGAHEHSGEDEVYIIQKGTGVLSDDGKDVEVSAGDAILTGNGASHAIRNSGNEDLVVTAIIMLYPQK